MENVVNPHPHHRLYLLDCNSLSTIWEVEVACYWFYLEGFYPLYYIFYFYNPPCIGEQLVRSAFMNQCFPGTSSVDCMQFNTSYLCFNYDDLLSVGSSGLLSQSAATSPVEYVIFYSILPSIHTCVCTEDGDLQRSAFTGTVTADVHNGNLVENAEHMADF